MVDNKAFEIDLDRYTPNKIDVNLYRDRLELISVTEIEKDDETLFEKRKRVSRRPGASWEDVTDPDAPCDIKYTARTKSKKGLSELGICIKQGHPSEFYKLQKYPKREHTYEKLDISDDVNLIENLLKRVTNGKVFDNIGSSYLGDNVNFQAFFKGVLLK